VVPDLHNARLSRWILSVVVVFVAAVIAVLVARGWTARSSRSEPPATAADYRIKDVRLSEETKRGTRWRLDAAQAESFEKLGRTVLKQVTIHIEEPDATWTVTGDEGELQQPSRNVELRGNVVLVSSEGFRLETSKLFWAGSEQRAWTNEPVTITRDGAVVRGEGLDADVAERVTSVKGRVRAVFSDAGGADKGPRRSAESGRRPRDRRVR
jgi:LPS export ABC transporter protein LptC